MPIIDACIVVPSGETVPSGVAKTLANAIAGVLGAEPGRVWVRVQLLPEGLYAENGEAERLCPVFLTVLHAVLPGADHLAREANELAKVVGASLGRPSELVHIEYAASGRGRVAFGGRLVR
jgi:hypothetical protein